MNFMETEFVNCREIVGGRRCGALAEITRRIVFESTDGPIEHIQTYCSESHVLFYPAYMNEDSAIPSAQELERMFDRDAA